MVHVHLDGVEVSYAVHGQGDHVVLLHAAAFEPWYEPLVDELPQFSILSYTRRPPRDHGAASAPLTLADDAVTCTRLMDHLGWSAAHAVGHSYGALVALQLAVDAPGRVGSLALLEPAIRFIPSAAQVLAGLAPAIAAYRSGERATAVDQFLRTVCGADYRATMDRVLPHAFDVAVDLADVFFRAEVPIVQQWSFGPSEAQLVTQPVLNVLGAHSVPRFIEGAELVQAWFPAAERLTLPDAGHLLMVENPGALAAGLADFFARHPDRHGGATAGPRHHA